MKPVIIIAIAFVLLIPISVYATHEDDIDYSNDPDYEGKTNLRIYTIFASATFFGCGDYDDEKLGFFKLVIKQILRQYDFLPITSNPFECVKVSGNVEFDKDGGDSPENYGLTLDSALDEAKEWHPNLIIILFDNKLSKQYNTETRYFEDGQWNVWGGHIEKHVKGKPDIIVSTSDLNEIEEQEGAWMLSHELAHFALRYYGESSSIWRDYVHDTHDDYRECQKTKFRDASCSKTYSTIKAYTGTFKILKPYEKPVYSKPLTSEPTCSTGTVLKNGICVTVESNPIPKYTTFANWETSSTTVYDNGYITLEGSIWANSKYDGRWDFVKYQTVAFYNHETYIGKSTTDSQGNFKFSAWMPDGINSYSVKYGGSNEWLGSTTLGPTINVIKNEIVEKKPEPQKNEPTYTSAQNKFNYIAMNYDDFPEWVAKVMYWYVYEEISSDEFEAIIDYLIDKHVICMGICSK